MNEMADSVIHLDWKGKGQTGMARGRSSREERVGLAQLVLFWTSWCPRRAETPVHGRAGSRRDQPHTSPQISLRVFEYIYKQPNTAFGMLFVSPGPANHYPCDAVKAKKGLSCIQMRTARDGSSHSEPPSVRLLIPFWTSRE